LPREPHIRVEYPGPTARKLLTAAAKNLSVEGEAPLVVESASGVSIIDVDGNVFLDFASGLYGNQTGHAHPSVVRAVIEKAQRLTVSYDFPYIDETAIELAERLRSGAPGQVRGPASFACSDDSALEAAMEAALAATGRPRVAVFTDEPSSCKEPPVTLSYPDCYRCPEGKKPGSCAVECLETCIGLLDSDDLRGQVAAVIFPPIRLSGGLALPDPDFTEGLGEFLKKRKILLVADETVTAMGRAGKMFASSLYKIAPDIIVCGGGLGTGMSAGAVISKDKRVGEAVRVKESANPVHIAAAAAAVDLVDRELSANARSMGVYLTGKLEELSESKNDIAAVLGKGLLISLEITGNPSLSEKDGRVCAEAAKKCRERGLLVGASGATSAVLAPPLVVTKSQIDAAVDILGAVLT
jgi:4-aminobutyrate aminotransferase-like enzyme